MSYLVTGVGLVGGLALLLAGGLVIRRARPTAGYLFMAAGAVLLLARCCAGLASPERLLEAGIDLDRLGLVMFAMTLTHATESILVSVLLAVALVMLAREVPRGGPS